MVASVGGVVGQVALGALSDARSFGAGYVVGGAVTALAVPALWALRSLREEADQLRGRARAGAEGTCPQGLPTVTGVEAVPVGAVAPE
jgi:hypothetical protein